MSECRPNRGGRVGGIPAADGAVLFALLLGLSHCPAGNSDAGTDDGGCTFASCREFCRARGEEYGSCAGGTCHCTPAPDVVGEDADAADVGPDDVPDAEDADGGADPWAIPLSARAEGEEWPFEPVFVRDLTSLAAEPKPGCEQVSFAEPSAGWPAGISAGSDGTGFDVFGDRLVFTEVYYPTETDLRADHVVLIDASERREYLVEGTASDGIEIRCTRTQITESGIAYMCRDDSGTRTAYTIWYDFERHTKRMLQKGEPTGIAAAYGSTVIRIKTDSDHDTGHQLWTIDAATGEQTNLTNFEPYGTAIWDVRIWGDRVVWTMHPRLGSTTLSERHGEVFLPGPAAQWSPVIWEDRVCWIDARDGTGDYYNPDGAQVYCADLTAGTERRVSSGPDDRGPHPRIAVYGDWVAWREGLPLEEREEVPDGVLMAYHWPTEIRRRVVGDREPWPAIPADAAFPHISGDYLYFAARDGNRITNCFRCDLRVLFADELETPTP